VTHSEENANYGNRIIRLEDAMITSETMSDSTKENAIVGA
jgi:ABC-type lipoprotein export system ATPase subunit